MPNKESPKKKETFFADGTDVMKIMSRIATSGTPEEKRSAAEAMRRGAMKEGQFCLNKALKEGLITETEWELWKKKYSLDLVDLGTILPAYYGWKNKELHEKPLITTMPDSNIMNAKALIKLKFGLDVIDILTFMKQEEERKKKEAKEEATYIG